MVVNQTVKQSVNQTGVISFSVTTTGSTSTEVITEATLSQSGYVSIHEIHVKITGDKCFLGLGATASTTHGINIIPVWKDLFYDNPNCSYDSLNVIRSGGTNITIEGYVTVR